MPMGDPGGNFAGTGGYGGNFGGYGGATNQSNSGGYGGTGGWGTQFGAGGYTSGLTGNQGMNKNAARSSNATGNGMGARPGTLRAPVLPMQKPPMPMPPSPPSVLGPAPTQPPSYPPESIYNQYSPTGPGGMFGSGSFPHPGSMQPAYTGYGPTGDWGTGVNSGGIMGSRAQPAGGYGGLLNGGNWQGGGGGW